MSHSISSMALVILKSLLESVSLYVFVKIISLYMHLHLHWVSMLCSEVNIEELNAILVLDFNLILSFKAVPFIYLWINFDCCSLKIMTFWLIHLLHVFAYQEGLSLHR